MSGRHVTLLMAGGLFLALPALALQDHAVPRGGGGGSSGGGAQHTPSFHSSGSGGSSNPGVSSPSSPGSSPGLTPAQQRHPRPGTGSGGGGHYPCYGCGYYPGYYPGYWGYWWPYGSYGWWGAGYWGWGYPWGAGPAYTYVEGGHGSIRVFVDPSDTRVYVDGYYAGIVDDFDGLFQRLNISPGTHEIALRLEGYKSHHVRVYLAPGATLKLQYEMEKGSGDTFEDLAGDAPGREGRRPRSYDDARPEVSEGREQGAPASVLHLIVRPADASVYVDGEFRGSGVGARSLEVTPGRHRVEVVRPGYGTQDREVDIGPQASTEVTIELEKP